MKIKIKYSKDVHTVHIPFIPRSGAYRELYEQIARVEYPKGTKRLSAKIEVSVDTTKNNLSWEISEVVCTKK